MPRVLVLMNPADPADAGAGTRPLGSPAAFRAAVAPFNTAPDGSSPATGTEVLHGPGIVIELPLGQDEIRQATVTVIDQDCAWPLLRRLCRTLGWRMQDVDSGQVFP